MALPPPNEITRLLAHIREGDTELEISVSTLKREWEFARAWLYERLKA